MHGITMIEFKDHTKPEHWSGYCLSNVFMELSDDEKDKMNKEFTDAVSEVKVKTILNEDK
jgi:hypothetical protein